jgi:hypothetical protein
LLVDAFHFNTILRNLLEFVSNHKYWTSSLKTLTQIWFQSNSDLEVSTDRILNRFKFDNFGASWELYVCPCFEL